MRMKYVTVWTFLVILFAVSCDLCIAADAGVANDVSLKEFMRSYPLKPVRGYTFLGTEKSNLIVWRADNATPLNVPVNKPCVLPDGDIDGWFNPGEQVPWVAEAMQSGQYTFGLVDGYLPAVRYVYRKAGTDVTCEMTAFAVDGEKPGSIFIHVALLEKSGLNTVSARYFKLGDTSSSTGAEFNAALQGLRKHWEAFFAEGAQIPIPDPDVMNACKASIIRALITYTGTTPHYGVLFYGLSRHDVFPPTTIAMVDCLLDWGQPERAWLFMTDYFNEFVDAEGRIDYYGPSIAEYGQLLWLSRKCVEAEAPDEWFEHLRPKLEAIRQWLWAAQADGPESLIKGSPEADMHGQVEVFFHNNGWAWRGLRDIAPLLGHADDAQRCEAFKQTIQEAVEKATNRSVSPPFISPKPSLVRPFTEMTGRDGFARYTNYRYWPELLSSGVLKKEQAEAIIDYRKSHDGEVAGLTQFSSSTVDKVDNWPMAEYARGLFDLGRREEIKEILYSHLAGHMTPETWTAYEQVSIKGEPHRSVRADYCVPSQLVAPRLAAWLWKTNAN